MKYYGSELWHKAIDNSNKVAIPCLSTSIEAFTKLLEENDICYFGFDNGKISKVSIDKADIELVKSIVGEYASVLKIEDVTKPYSPPAKNIFGTIDYKYISKNTRKFITAESDMEQRALLRTAELLKRDGVKFSGRVYDNKITITLNNNDVDTANKYYQRVLSNIQLEKAPEIAEEKKSNVLEVVEAMAVLGFTNEQITGIYTDTVLELSEFQNVDISDYINYLNPHYTPEQNAELMKLLSDVYKNGGFDIFTESEVRSKLYQTEKMYKSELLLRRYFENHNFNSEQTDTIREIFTGTFEETLPHELEAITEIYSPAEIKELHELWLSEEKTSEKVTSIQTFTEKCKQGMTGIGYTESFKYAGNGSFLWTHHSTDNKGEYFRTYTVTYKELLLAKNLFDDPKDIFDYIEKTSAVSEARSMLSDVITDYRNDFTGGELHTYGDMTFFDKIEKMYSHTVEIFSLETLSSIISDKINEDLSKEQLKERINTSIQNILINGNGDDYSGYSRSDVSLLCSELLYSPFSEIIQSRLTQLVENELDRKGITIVAYQDTEINSTSVPLEQKLESERTEIQEDVIPETKETDLDTERTEPIAENNKPNNNKNVENKEKKEQTKKAVVTNVWSDFEYFEGEGQTYSIGKIDKLMKSYDTEIQDRKAAFAESGDHYPTFSMEFTLTMPDGRVIEESRELGTGIGGLLDFLKSQGDNYKDIIPQLEEQLDRENNSSKKRTTRKQKQQNEDLRQLSFADVNNESVKQENTNTDNNEPVIAAKSDNTPDRADNLTNYHITDDHIGEGTPLERFKNNIEAIKTLKAIESENRAATPDEQETLAKYVGWGGLSNYFNDKHPSNLMLRKLLTDKEYRAAKESTMTAFYTPPIVMKAMYKKLGEMGFDGGRVLEPSCGIGNFIGTMPTDLRQNCDIHAVELDSISGRIAQKLYPAADIQVKGFEKTRFNDNVFDVAIGNVPFGDFSVRDNRYDKYNWRIHNYFFGKSLDKLRPGGVAAFLTSRYTLDSQNSSFRQYLAERADLLGAIRLPTGTFSKSAGTEVVSDIIFLKKRDEVGMPEIVPDWVYTTHTANGFSVNTYFSDNPEMVLGDIGVGKGMNGRTELVVNPNDKTSLSEQLERAMQNIKGSISERKSLQLDEEVEEQIQNAAPEDIRNYSLYEQGNRIYFKSDDQATLWAKGKSETIAQRAKEFIKLRDTTRNILEAMINDCSDIELKAFQDELNKQYDLFRKKYGLVHSRYNRSLFSDDISYQLVAALESKYDLTADPPTCEKSALFTKRTIRPPVPITCVDTAQEALALSMAQYGKVDFDFMTELYQADKDTIIKELEGQIFPVPELSAENDVIYQEASEYLSGDIRQKLRNAEKAAETNPTLYSANIIALKDVMPEPLKAGDIDAKIGAAWINPEFYEQFMYETFHTPDYKQRNENANKFSTIELSYSDITNSYFISNKFTDRSVFTTKTFGLDIKGANAYDIFENLLNMKDTKIYKEDKETATRTIDRDLTKAASKVAEKIEAEFSNWIFKDPERRDILVKQYNEMYNSTRPREYNGSALTFPGMNAEINLRPHQKDAVAHALYGGNTLFDHSVGAGKTFEMIASIMERKRLGLSNKALMAVPNHLTEQIGDDFQKLYPNANILVATKSDFTKQKRRALMAKIATGDYDAVIIGHSQLGKIPLSKETQERYLNEEVDQLTAAIEEMKKEDGRSFSVKQAEKQRKKLRDKLEELETLKDDIVSFEELGIDCLVVDEAHEFKNLYTPTNMQNVSGISSSASQKANDLYMKCRYLNEKTDNTGIIFATGTPISNSVTELYTMQRYLQNDLLVEKKMSHFDQWIGLFGKRITDHQIDPTGKSYKLKTRIAKYTNMTELMNMFKTVTDIKTAEMMNLDVPKCETTIVNVEPTDLQQALVEELSLRADEVQDRKVDPTVDNLLKITSDGRKVGLDPRLIDPDLEDNPNTKLNKCVENVLNIYRETESERLTQLIFCDLGVPNSKNKANTAKDEDDDEKSVLEKESFEESGNFCIYDDIKKKLINNGVKPEEIAYIHDAKTDEQKSKLFEKVRSGEVRVLLGSTPKMGTGTNIQTKLVALHDLDVPWRPSDLEQRLGRMVRQGNKNKTVKLFRYVTKGTFDAYSYQMLENKQRYISQLYTSNARTCEDVDQQSLSYSEIKTLCTGDPRIKEVFTLTSDIETLTILRHNHFNTLYEMQDKIKSFEKSKAETEAEIANTKKDLAICEALPKDEETGGIAFEMTIDGETYTDKKEAAKALESAFNNALFEFTKGETVKLATIQGFDVNVYYSPHRGDYIGTINGNASYFLKFSALSHSTNIKRMVNILDGMRSILFDRQDSFARAKAEVVEAQRIVNTPFKEESELNEKTARRDQLKSELQKEQAAKLLEKNSVSKERYYFKIADMKRNGIKIKQQAKQQTSQQTNNKKQEI